MSTWSGRIPFTDLPKKPRDFKLLSDVGALSISPPSWQTEKRTLDLLSERYGVCHFYTNNGAVRLKQNLEVTKAKYRLCKDRPDPYEAERLEQIWKLPFVWKQALEP